MWTFQSLCCMQMEDGGMFVNLIDNEDYGRRTHLPTIEWVREWMVFALGRPDQSSQYSYGVNGWNCNYLGFKCYLFEVIMWALGQVIMILIGFLCWHMTVFPGLPDYIVDVYLVVLWKLLLRTLHVCDWHFMKDGVILEVCFTTLVLLKSNIWSTMLSENILNYNYTH